MNGWMRGGDFLADAEFNVVNNTGLVKSELEKRIKEILEAWGQAGETFAKEEITKVVYDTPPSPNYNRTGNLRNSLTHDEGDRYTYIGTNVYYAPYVEMGTSRMPPRPYLRPAVEHHIKEYKAIADKLLRG